jgi:DNA-binding MarR family transcriptional regulator
MINRSFNYKALADFRHAIRLYINFSERNARRAGLEPQQYQAMLALKGYSNPQEMSIRQLAERLQIRHHSAVELIDRLNARGLVRRNRSNKDRRKVLLRLTPRGEQKLRRVAIPHREELRTAGRNLVESLQGFLSHEGSERNSSRRR